MTRKAIKEPTVTFGIRAKLFIFLGLIALVLFSTAMYGWYWLTRIASSSQAITEHEVPLARGIREALVAMLEGQFALEETFMIDDFLLIGEIQRHESNFNSSIVRFDTYVAAIARGSESEAFAKSDGGLNLAEWQRLHSDRPLIIKRPSPEQVQLAGITEIYFSGFAQNALKAIANHKKSLRLRSADKIEQAQEADEAVRQYTARARRFSGLTTISLSRIARISNITVSAAAKDIEETQRAVQQNIFLIFAAGSILSLAGGIIFVRKVIIQPLQTLTKVAQNIGSGNLATRAIIQSGDETKVLANVFNTMADRLTDYAENLEVKVEERTKELTKASDRLKELLAENYTSAKMLIQRDRELTAANENLGRLNADLNETGKVLVRRDLELSEANARLQELDALKSDFVSVAAHQLRTPLTGVRWSYETLLEAATGPLTAEQRKIVDGGHKAVLRLVALVGDLLNVARIEEGRFGFRLERQSIRPLLEESAKRFALAAADKGLHFVTQLPAKDLPAVELDTERMELALDNLLDNAVKYTPPGGTVRLRAAAAPDQLRITVSDTGIGIPASQMHRLFTKFFRADNALLFQTTGSGLGLYVVKNIVSNHSGTISIESREGRGTTASISLPLAD